MKPAPCAKAPSPPAPLPHAGEGSDDGWAELNRAEARPLPLIGPAQSRDTHITVTIQLSRASTLYGVRVLLDSMAYALRAKIRGYRDESGHLHFDLTLPDPETAR